MSFLKGSQLKFYIFLLFERKQLTVIISTHCKNLRTISLIFGRKTAHIWPIKVHTYKSSKSAVFGYNESYIPLIIV